MTWATASLARAPRCAIREIDPASERDIAAVAGLHLELLWFGPMAQLGELFLRKFCYTVLLKDGLMRAALCEVEGEPAGFIAYTDHSITFHRRAIRDHWVYVGWLIALSVMRSPRVMLRLVRAIRLMFSRRAEQQLGEDPMAEVIALGVLRQYLSAEFVRRTGRRISEELLQHAINYFKGLGMTEMRMIVDADNKAPLLLYHRLGARFESYEQAGKPVVHVRFQL